MERPSIALLESAYDELFHSTLDNIIDSASYGRLFLGRQDHEEGVAGRSMAWKLFLSLQPPLTASLNPHPVPPLNSLRASREHYVSLLKDKMRAPDGSYEEGFNLPGRSTPTSAAPKKPDNWNLNNPLSLDSSNPWHAYFSALESRNIIRQDVERTFPDNAYFRSPVIQNEMTQILFIHSSERENVGYRQGMHELLACIYYAVDFDSIETWPSPAKPELQELCDRMYVAADSYELFKAIMQRMEPWYEWRAPIPEQISPTSSYNIPHFSANGEMVHSNSQPLVNVLANGQLDLQRYVAPIVTTCASLRDEKLRVVDPNLWEKICESGVEPQMYGIRWLRLLFTREFSLSESMVIWDGLFASVASNNMSSSSSSSSHPGTFELALWISVAMLIRIRNTLIPGDYTTQLTQLLRYPTPSSLGSSMVSNAPALLLKQAQLLMDSPTPGTGASLVMQNRNELGIPVEVPSPQSSPVRTRRPSAPATAPPTITQGRTTHAQDKFRLQDMITNRLLDANESLGIQKSFFNTISELRKNLPDLSQTLIRTPSWNGSSMSLIDDRIDVATGARSHSFSESDVDERPPWEPKPRSEVEREINELRQLLKKLGDAVGWAVDVLLLHEDEAENSHENEKSVRERKAEAVECMSYVRDVLARGGKGDIDEERLVSEEEYKRRKHIKKDRSTTAAASVDAPLPGKHVLPPPRIAAPDNNTSYTSTKSQHSRDSSMPTSPLTRTPLSYSHLNQTSDTPLASFSTRTNQASRHKPPLSTPITESKKVVPPWQHTPSNFSGDSPYISGSLPRYPPPSTTAPPRKLSDHSVSRNSPSDSTESSTDQPRTDPLGVLR